MGALWGFWAGLVRTSLQKRTRRAIWMPRKALWAPFAFRTPSLRRSDLDGPRGEIGQMGGLRGGREKQGRHGSCHRTATFSGTGKGGVGTLGGGGWDKSVMDYQGSWRIISHVVGRLRQDQPYGVQWIFRRLMPNEHA